MTAEEYVHEELTSGRLTAAHIVELVEEFQAQHHLFLDGKPGPKTIEVIEQHMRDGITQTLTPTKPQSTPFLICPLPTLKDGRMAVVTSSFRPKDRPNHDGCDWFYPYKEGDGDRIGDGGRTAKWIVPAGTAAFAAANGTVQIAGNSPTGYRVWIDHGNGWRTGYFHLTKLFVAVGDKVLAGFTQIGEVGDNPKDNDARHLHFELSPVDKYAPVDPEPYLMKNTAANEAALRKAA